MISNQKFAMIQFIGSSALFLLCVVPSTSFVVPMYTKRPPSPLPASTRSGRIDTIGDSEAMNSRFGVPPMTPFLFEDERARASVLATSLVVESASITVPCTALRNIPQLVYEEIAVRSLVKALVWRLTAAVVTLVSGLVFSGRLTTAVSIVGSDILTKSGFMFLGERLSNRVKWGQGKDGDSAQRSLAKAILWRLFAASNTLICGVFCARDVSVASKIAGTDTIIKTGLFFVNERIWSTIKWGKKYEPEYFI